MYINSIKTNESQGQNLWLHQTSWMWKKDNFQKCSLSTYDEEYYCSLQIYDYLPLLLNKSILHHLSSRKRVVLIPLAPFIMITAASVPVWVRSPDVVSSSAVWRHKKDDPHWQIWLTAHQNPSVAFFFFLQAQSWSWLVLFTLTFTSAFPTKDTDMVMF